MSFLPIFPLQLVAFPFENLNLHAFEPRYKQLINDCLEKGLHFGIPSVIDKNLNMVGTEMELLSIEKTYSDGRMDIKTKGKRIFRITKYHKTVPDKLYSGAKVEWLDFDLEGQYTLYEEIINQIKELYQYMNIKKEVPQLTSEFNTFQIAHLVGFSINQEYKFLQISEERNRQDYLLNHLTKLIPVVKNMEELRKKIQMNGHFKNVTGSGEW
ncbi:MAG: LON peptidase substrate-binding domain-containing protein [Saprospiraceae bacterium]|jgi:Lon protease-like protein|nr:LON peptidase substrate-binding domain-containing protein [Saprospiraceae bacterium]